MALVWVALAVAGAANAKRTGDRLDASYTFPGQAGYRANMAIAEHYHTGGMKNPVAVMISLPSAQSMSQPAAQAATARAFSAAHATGPLRILGYAGTGNRTFLLDGGRATYDLMFPPYDAKMTDHAPAILAAVKAAAPAGATVRATGFDQLAAAGSKKGGVSLFAETIIGGLGALVVLGFLYASFLAVLPLLVAIVSVLTTFLLLLGLTAITSVTNIAEFLIALVGLGIAIDYSLLLATRWREERAKGADRQAAVENAVATAGRSVLFSGVAVAVGLASLSAVPVQFLRSLGYSGLLIPLVSVAVTLTLLPIILYTFGDRLDWPHRRRRKEGQPSRAWAAWARGVIRVRWAAAVAGVAILAAFIIPFFSMHAGEPDARSLSTSGSYRTALNDLEGGGMPAGALRPIEVIVKAGAASQIQARLAMVDGVRAALAPASFHQGGTALVDVLPTADSGSAAGAQTLAGVIKAVGGDQDVIGVGGTGAADRDFSTAVYGNFPVILTVLSIVTFLLLMFMFRSVLLALKAVLFNLASLGAAYGILTLVWQRGYGSQALFAVPATGAITVWVPFIVFAFLFGLSMDYEVFILSRIREEHDRGAANRDAIVSGVARTGRLVTGAALILFLVFLSLATGPLTEIKMMGTALGAGILLDATVVRALLVPAVISLFGPAAWWLPGRRGRAGRELPQDRPLKTAGR
ncbi:MAG TPA: MMPL family transporter [Streptosporangiaceae bacterium]